MTADSSLSPGPAPEISVVLPVYNGERYLRAALESVLGQTFTDFELIAVDDCSTDSSPAILAEFAARDSRVRIVTQPENRKLPAALNAGFGEAKGRWFTWTSDDNLMLPETLAELHAAALAYPQTDIVYAGYRLLREDGVPDGAGPVGDPEDLVFANTIGCCFLYRREVDQQVGGYDESLFGIEDYDFWLRVHAAGFAFHRIHQQLYIYRRHRHSLTDRRARHIRELGVRVLAPRVEELPEGRRRAQAWLRLATRDPYAIRPRFVWRALCDDPTVVVRHWREIVDWLKSIVRVRLT